MNTLKLLSSSNRMVIMANNRSIQSTKRIMINNLLLIRRHHLSLLPLSSFSIFHSNNNNFLSNYGSLLSNPIYDYNKRKHCDFHSRPLSSTFTPIKSIRFKTTMRNVAVDVHSSMNMDVSMPMIKTIDMVNSSPMIKRPAYYRQEMLNEYPFLLLASTILPSSLKNDSINVQTESQSFFHDIAAKCSDENFMSQMNLLLNDNCSRQQLLTKLRLLCNYNPNFLRFLIYDNRDSLSLFCNNFEHQKDLRILENFFWAYYQVYNHNLNGLIAMMMMNVIHHSKNCFNHWFPSASVSLAWDSLFEDKLLFDMAICFDLIGCAIELHDWIVINERSKINEYHHLKQKFTNILVLTGDYCFVRMLAISVLFYDVNLLNCLVNGQLWHVAGEFSSFDVKYSSGNYSNDNYSVISNDVDKIIEQFEHRILTADSERPSASLWDGSSWSMLGVNRLLSYCYMTSGYQLSHFISKMFHKYGLNDDAQKFAMEFGHNLGIAIKLFNLSDNSLKSLDVKMINDVNKFDDVPIDIKRQLFEHYIDKTKNLLDEHIIQRRRQQQQQQQESTQLSDRSMIFIDLFKQYLDQLQISSNK